MQLPGSRTQQLWQLLAPLWNSREQEGKCVFKCDVHSLQQWAVCQTNTSLSHSTFPQGPQSSGHRGTVPSFQEAPSFCCSPLASIRQHRCLALCPQVRNVGCCNGNVLLQSLLGRKWSTSSQWAFLGRWCAAATSVQHATGPLPETRLLLLGTRNALLSDPVTLTEDISTFFCCLSSTWHIPAPQPPGRRSYSVIP